MNLALVGVSHKTAGFDTRERVALSAEQIPSRLAELVSCGKANEAVLLSTCNRSELYVVLGNGCPLLQGEEMAFQLRDSRARALTSVQQ